MQIEMLETKLAVVLPTLPRQSLSTAYVLAELESALGKPAGRLDRFRPDVERIWSAWAEAKPVQRRRPRRKKKPKDPQIGEQRAT